MVELQAQKASQKSAIAEPEPGAGQNTTFSKPKKKKKKYSRGLRAAQKSEVALTKGLNRLARAVEEGIGSWRKNRTSSASKRRDGAVRDAIKNYGKAITKFQKVAAKIPEDVTNSIGNFRRLLR